MFNIIMKESEFLNIINNTLSDNKLLGEDCAFLPDLNIYITQDTLIEGIHFDRNFTDFFTLAKKSVAVNLSDLAANLADPKYISVSISAPTDFSSKNMEDFYKGIEDCCKKYKISVCGGDLTGSTNGICISVCAIGTPICKTKVSRDFAKEEQIVCVTKNYGSSAYALQCLLNNNKCGEDLLKTHLEPVPDIEISKKLAQLNYDKIAIMDSSDGLCDALFKIAQASNKSIEVDFSKIPYDKEIENYNGNFKDLILWGGEDYGLVFCVEEKDLPKLKDNAIKIGTVKPKQKNYVAKIDDLKIDEKIFSKKCYNHFKKGK